MTQRFPTQSSVPGCWGRYRGDDECCACEEQDRCSTAAQWYKSMGTLAETIEKCRAETKTPVEQPSPSKLADMVRDAILKNRPGHYVNKSTNRVKFHTVMNAVIESCDAHGWSAARFVEAQLFALTPHIKQGRAVYPGHFSGEAANARFERWVVRTNERYGNARIDNVNDREVAAASRIAAAITYAMAKYIYKRGEDGAAADARDVDPTWSMQGATKLEQLEALHAVVTFKDARLPDMVLVPSDGWTWAMVDRLFAQLEDADEYDDEPPAKEGDDTEGLDETMIDHSGGFV